MSGQLLGAVWGAVSIETPSGPKPIDPLEKLILARFADSGSDEGIVSHLSWPRLEAECCLSRREIARIMSRFRTCPHNEKYRTVECGEPGGRCIHHWGLLDRLGIFTTSGIRCRRYRLRVELLLDKNGEPRRCPTGTFEGVQRAPLKVSDRHPIPPIPNIPLATPANLINSANSVSSSSSWRAGRKNRRRTVDVPEPLMAELLGKKLNEQGEVYSPAAVVRLWSAVVARDPGATSEQVIEAINRTVKENYFARRGIRSLIGLLYTAVPSEFGVDRKASSSKNSRVLRPASGAKLASGCVCGRRGRCEFCRREARRQEARKA